MHDALREAEVAAHENEVPVGAVIVRDHTVIAACHNTMEQMKNPVAHAEMLAIQQACRILGQHRLDDCDLYVTLEPCPMCAQAISFARIQRVYFAAYDPKGGGVDNGPRIFQQSSCHYTPEIYGGILETESKQLLRTFFKKLR